jgi:hypothetical protein
MTSSAYRESCEGCRELRAANEALLDQTERLRADRKVCAVHNVGRWLGLVGSVFVTSAAVAAIFGWACQPSVPEPAPPCRDSAEVITSIETRRSCHEAAALTTETVNPGQVLVRCICPRSRPRSTEPP